MSIDLDTLERIARAATPGPWIHVWNHGAVNYIKNLRLIDDRSLVWLDLAGEPSARSDDMSHIAAASPSTVLEMVAELRALREQLHLTQTVLYRYLDGVEHSDSACPEDDTCECENVRLINAAMKGWRPLPPAPVKQGEAHGQH